MYTRVSHCTISTCQQVVFPRLNSAKWTLVTENTQSKKNNQNTAWPSHNSPANSVASQTAVNYHLIIISLRENLYQLVKSHHVLCYRVSKISLEIVRLRNRSVTHALIETCQISENLHYMIKFLNTFLLHYMNLFYSLHTKQLLLVKWHNIEKITTNSHPMDV